MQKLIICLVLFAGNACAISLVSGTNICASDTVAKVTTSPIDTTGSNLIVLYLATNTAVVAGGNLTDSKGNTYTLLTVHGPMATPSESRLAYVFNPIVGSGHTFTLAGVAPAICVAGFSSALAFDTQNGAVNENASTPTLATGSITPSVANELVITGVGGASAAGISINSSFTIAASVPFVVGTAYSAALAYRIPATTGALNPTWTAVDAGFGTVQGTSIASFTPAIATSSIRHRVSQ